MAVAPARHAAAQASEGRRAAQTVSAEDLFAQHRRRIYGYCLRRLWSPEEAEDAVQTTYLRAWRSLHDGRQPYNPLAWLYEIAKNVCIRSLERRSRQGALVPLDDEAASEEPSGARDELFGLEDALVRIPERQRRALLLREWRGLSYKEIAEEMGLSASAVEMLIFRSRRALAAELEQPSAPRRVRMPSLAAWLDGLRSAIPHGFSTSMATGLAIATATSLSPTLLHRGLAPTSLPSSGKEVALRSSPDAIASFDGRALTPTVAMGTGRGQPPGNGSGQDAAPAPGTGSTAPENQGSGASTGGSTAQPNDAPVDAPGPGTPLVHPPIDSAPAQLPDGGEQGGGGATPATPAIPAVPGPHSTPATPATPAIPATPPSHSNGHKQDQP